MIKPEIKARYAVFPGGLLNINRPDLGIVGSGMWFEQLVKSVAAYRRANGHQIGLGMEEEIARVVCATVPGACVETDTRGPTNQRLTMADVVHGTEVFLRDQFAGSPRVSLDEANRRANICARCPYQVQWARSCASIICGAMKSVWDKWGGAEELAQQSNLHACSVCKCYNSISVWFDLKIQQEVLTDEQKATFLHIRDSGLSCWKYSGL